MAATTHLSYHAREATEAIVEVNDNTGAVHLGIKFAERHPEHGFVFTNTAGVNFYITEELLFAFSDKLAAICTERRIANQIAQAI